MNNEQRSYRTTIDAPPPLPLAHLTMTDRFRLYDRACAGLGYLGVWPYQVTEWALSVGLIGAPRAPLPHPGYCADYGHGAGDCRE
jgi:hypothetical protein